MHHPSGIQLRITPLRDKLNKFKERVLVLLLLTGQWNSSPSEMIGALDWNSLELLCKGSSLVMLDKIVNGQIASAQDLLPKFSRCSSSNFQQVLAHFPD